MSGLVILLTPLARPSPERIPLLLALTRLFHARRECRPLGMLKGIQQQPEIGIRVKILGVRELLGAQYPPGNPQSKHTGKTGTIGRWPQVTEDMRSLIIRLDDGTEMHPLAINRIVTIMRGTSFTRVHG